MRVECEQPITLKTLKLFQGSAPVLEAEALVVMETVTRPEVYTYGLYTVM